MASNEKALREALEKVVALSVADDYANVCLKNVIADCEEALAKPPRNCDVGTEEEQRRRFIRFCESGQHTDKACCGGCPIVVEGHREKVGVSCELAWAQMPYVEVPKAT